MLRTYLLEPQTATNLVKLEPYLDFIHSWTLCTLQLTPLFTTIITPFTLSALLWNIVWTLSFTLSYYSLFSVFATYNSDFFTVVLIAIWLLVSLIVLIVLTWGNIQLDSVAISLL